MLAIERLSIRTRSNTSQTGKEALCTLTRHVRGVPDARPVKHKPLNGERFRFYEQPPKRAPQATGSTAAWILPEGVAATCTVGIGALFRDCFDNTNINTENAKPRLTKRASTSMTAFTYLFQVRLNQRASWQRLNLLTQGAVFQVALNLHRARRHIESLRDHKNPNYSLRRE